MRRLQDLEWLPLVFGLVGALLVLALANPKAEASHRLLQTVPTPTPRYVPTPSGIATPGGRTGSAPSGEKAPILSELVLRQTVSHHDVLPGEELEFSFWLTNTSTVAITGIVLVDALDSLLAPLEVQATQGAVRFEKGTAFVHLGALQPSQSALVVLRARVGAEAQAGHIVLNQFMANFDQGGTSSNVVSVALPPDALPATGRAGRGP